MLVPEVKAGYIQGTTAEIAAQAKAGLVAVDSQTGEVKVTASNAGTSIVPVSAGANVRLSNASGNTIATVQTIVRTTTATPADGIGGEVVYSAPNDASPPALQRTVTLTFTMTDVSDGSEASSAKIGILIAGNEVVAFEMSAAANDDESVGVLLFRQGGNYVAKRVLQGADMTGPGGANRALYVVT